MATMDKIKEVLNSDQFDQSDKSVVIWQFHLTGHFKHALWEAILLADEGNLERLNLGFPTEVEGFKRWSRDDLATRLRTFGLDI